MKRRDFLKCGLAVGVVGVSSLTAMSSMAACSNDSIVGTELDFAPPAGGLTASHWGLVIDLRLINESDVFGKIASACHTNHNVPSIDDPKIEVKWIWQEGFEDSFADQRNELLSSSIKEYRLPVLCNHCENPACVRVCPTQATFQQADGIVSMDYHRCIGCRFCMTACPYNSRSLNYIDPRPYIDVINPDFPTRTKGVVEKCNFCIERLNLGLAPHCVEASGGAILFGDLEDPNSDVRLALAKHMSLRRLAHLGTNPSVYYILSEGDSHA